MKNYKVATLFSCIDNRLHCITNGKSVISRLAESLNVRFDLVSRAGGVLGLASPEIYEYSPVESIINDIKTSIRLNDSEKIILLAHEDCGAYKKIIEEGREESSVHYNHLRKARSVLGDSFSGITIKMFFACLEEESENFFLPNAEEVEE